MHGLRTDPGHRFSLAGGPSQRRRRRRRRRLGATVEATQWQELPSQSPRSPDQKAEVAIIFHPPFGSQLTGFAALGMDGGSDEGDLEEDEEAEGSGRVVSLLSSQVKSHMVAFFSAHSRQPAETQTLRLNCHHACRTAKVLMLMLLGLMQWICCPWP
eukprot:scaffold86361_cov40-Prasinocladus_malaysianus.AAC.1